MELKNCGSGNCDFYLSSRKSGFTTLCICEYASPADSHYHKGNTFFISSGITKQPVSVSEDVKVQAMGLTPRGPGESHDFDTSCRVLDSVIN